MSKEIAVIVGVGPALGRALVARCSSEGMTVAAIARDVDRLRETTKGLKRVSVYGADATNSQEMKATFRRIAADLGEPDLAVFNAGTFQPGEVLNITPEELERCWKVGCLGGLITAQEAAHRMLPRGRGSIIFTGATAALRGSKGFANLAVPKFGLRALSQCLARELGPKGIHVAHVIVDGQIDSERHAGLKETRGPDALLQPKHIAENYMMLHRQPRDAWTQELDMRPWVEKF